MRIAHSVALVVPAWMFVAAHSVLAMHVCMYACIHVHLNRVIMYRKRSAERNKNVEEQEQVHDLTQGKKSNSQKSN